jgi:hypothetical protein
VTERAVVVFNESSMAEIDRMAQNSMVTVLEAERVWIGVLCSTTGRPGGVFGGGRHVVWWVDVEKKRDSVKEEFCEGDNSLGG